MATNFYFNNFNASQEQFLIENLIIESIKIYGMDMIYIPRIPYDQDTIYGEAPTAEYNDWYSVEMYIKNVEGFEGQGDFLSKFNLEIRDRVTFTIARRSFDNEVGSESMLDRPNEGDLIYFPLNNKIFEIKFVEHEAMFYQLGALQTYDLQCELFEYTNQIFNTGIDEIDSLNDKYSISVSTDGILTEDSFVLADENNYILSLEGDPLENARVASDNKMFQTEAAEFLDFSETDPFAERTY